MITISTFSLIAQRTVFSMSEYNKENGLPEELVKDIVTDRNGIPHFATDDGLYALMYGEYHRINQPMNKSSFFKAFYILQDQTILVVSDDALYKLIQSGENNHLELFIDCNKGLDYPQYPKNIFEDSSNRIWIADHSDVFCYKEGKLHKYKMDEKNKSTSFVRSYQFVELDQGHIIAISQKGWFYKFNEGTNSFEGINEKAEFTVHSIFLHRSNEFLLGTSKGLMNYKCSSEGLILEKKILDPYIVASCIIPIKNGRFLVGTWFQGLLEINFQPQFEVYSVGGFPSFTIYNMHRDRFGCVWTATNSGVVHLEKEFFSTQFLNSNTDYVNNVVKDGRYVYFLNGKEVYRVNPDYSVEIYLALKANNSTKLAIWNDLILVGNEKGEIDCYKDKKLMFHFKLSNIDVTDIAINSKYEAWAVSNSELFKLDLLNGNQKSYLQQFGGERVVFDVEYVNRTDLIICGAKSDTYLFRYKKEDDSIRNISVEANFMNGKEFWTTDIEITGDSILIGSIIGLIKYFDGKVELVDLGKFTDKDVNSVTRDNSGNLWISGSKGILRKSGDDISLFTKEDGLPSKTSYSRNMLVDSTGVMWVGTSNGLCYADIKESPKRSPKPLLYGVHKKDHVLLSDKNYEANKNATILFDVSSLFYPQAKNIFEYCIKNNLTDEDMWLPLTSKNQILIPGLKLGNYQLKLRTKHAGNYYWSEETILPIRVNEVWYLRWFSIIFYVLFILVLIYLTYLTSKNRAYTRMLNLRRMINEKTKDLKELNQELKMANISKDKFISILAHDLRNPFNAIRGFSQILVDDSEVLNNDEKQELIEMIYKSSDDTFKLLENLLEWANVQKGSMLAKPESFNLRVIMQNNLETHQKLATIKKIKIDGEFQDMFVKADKYMLDTIVRNLISNAIKYSYPEDIINLDIEEVGDMAVIKIKDHGVGMSSSQVKQLFKIDSISSTTGTSDETGSGFGLMLSKEFIDLNEGRIEVSSEKDKGTVFSVFIPLDK
jgi:signal transduction histidine kinase/ligand-binding sensor domain-containing protein